MMHANEHPRPMPDDWRNHAACSGMDPAIFWPAPGENDKVRQARSVCAACPSQADCLDYALADPTLDGIWGGATRRERSATRSSRNGQSRSPKPINHGTIGGYRTHLRRKEPACDDCQTAQRVYKANYDAEHTRSKPA